MRSLIWSLHADWLLRSPQREDGGSVLAVSLSRGQDLIVTDKGQSEQDLSVFHISEKLTCILRLTDVHTDR